MRGMLNNMPLTQIMLIAGVVTLAAALLLVLTQKWHGHFSADGDSGVQKIHEHAPPRIGGVAIICGLATFCLMSGPAVVSISTPMLLACLPAFLSGLAEDITKKVSVLARLLATMLSGFLAYLLTGVAMQNTGFAPLDWLLAITPVAVCFTLFAVGGVANAINIIDGCNGLASGAVGIMMVAMGLISLSVGDVPLSTVSFVIAAISLGFCAANWPLGKIFLGDGGAYLLGFLLAWVAILLPMRNPQLSGWTTLLVCAYPVLEVVFSVLRRRSREGHHPGQPDKVHLHHLVHRRLVCHMFPSISSRMKNGLTSPFCWVGVALPAGLAILFAQNIFMLSVSFAGVAFLYSVVYTRLSQFHWCLSAQKNSLPPVL